MLITKLEDALGKEVEIMVGGHFFMGRIVEVDPAGDSIVFTEDDGNNVTIDAGAVQLLKLGGKNA